MRDLLLRLMLLFMVGYLSRSAYAGMAPLVPQQQTGSADTHDQHVQFKARTILVQVPVVVSDKAGKHIHNLSKSDFRVFQDKKEQKIAVLDEVTAPAEPPSASSYPPNTFSNLAIKTDRPCALTVIVLDDINTNILDQTYGRMTLTNYLSHNVAAGQALVLMLMTAKGVKKLVDATADKSLLLSHLRKLGSDMPAPEDFDANMQALQSAPQETSRDLLRRSDAAEAMFLQDQAIDKTMNAFLSIAWSLSGFPGRKSLVWLTGSFPFFLDPKYSDLDTPRLSLLYQRTMEALNDAQISVYPVDVRGLVAVSDISSAHRSFSSLDRPRANVPGTTLVDSTIENLRVFAEMTGGRAFYNSNDLAAGFRQAIEDSQSYYMLGYYLDSRGTKPGWRELKVALTKTKWNVRARSGFVAGNATLNPQSLHNADEKFALASPVDSTGIPLTLRWNRLPAASRNEQEKVEFDMVLPADSVIDISDATRCDIDFIWQADKNGVTVIKDEHRLKGTLSAAGLAEVKRVGVTYRNALALKPGDYQVRFVVRDNLTGRIGSLTAPLTVN